MTTNNTSRAAALTDAILEQAQVYASAWSLIDGPFDHGNALATAENEKAELRTLVADTIAPLVAQQVAPADLEGLSRAILTPRAIVRDQDGMLSHPAIPYLDEDVNYETFFAAFGIDAAFIHMENDVDGDTYDQYFESNSANCSMWTPSTPAGDGWILLEIYDTEDGPVALFVREKKPESMRECRKREDLERHAAAHASLPTDELAVLPQIPDLVKATAWLTMCLRTELSRLDETTHRALDEVEAQLSCVRAITNGAIDYEAIDFAIEAPRKGGAS